MEHYSKRLQRNFEDDDLLTRYEAAMVLVANSDRAVSTQYVTDMASRGVFHPVKVGMRVNLYKYSELKDYVVRRQTGRRLHEDPAPSAIRQRRYKERHGLKKAG